MSVDKKIRLRLLCKILLTAGAGVALFLIAYSMVSTLYDKPRFQYATYGICALVFVFAVYKIGLFQLLFDRSWEGTITEITPRKGILTKGFRASVNTVVSVMFYDITVRTQDGREIEFSVNSNNVHQSYYTVGMELIHKRGYKYPVAKSPAQGKIMCPLCGSTLFENKCSKCNIVL